MADRDDGVKDIETAPSNEEPTKVDGFYILQDIFGREVGLMWKNNPTYAGLLYSIPKGDMGQC